MPRIKCNLPEFPTYEDLERCDGFVFGCECSKEKCDYAHLCMELNLNKVQKIVNKILNKDQ